MEISANLSEDERELLTSYRQDRARLGEAGAREAAMGRVAYTLDRARERLKWQEACREWAARHPEDTRRMLEGCRGEKARRAFVRDLEARSVPIPGVEDRKGRGGKWTLPLLWEVSGELQAQEAEQGRRELFHARETAELLARAAWMLDRVRPAMRGWPLSNAVESLEAACRRDRQIRIAEQLAAALDSRAAFLVRKKVVRFRDATEAAQERRKAGETRVAARGIAPSCVTAAPSAPPAEARSSAEPSETERIQAAFQALTPDERTALLRCMVERASPWVQEIALFGLLVALMADDKEAADSFKGRILGLAESPIPTKRRGLLSLVESGDHGALPREDGTPSEEVQAGAGRIGSIVVRELDAVGLTLQRDGREVDA